MSFIDSNRSLLLSNGHLSITDPANMTGYALYLTNNTASYWTITIVPLQTGTFTITFTFSQTGYITTTITLTLNVQTNAFVIQYTNGTSWINDIAQSKYYNQGSNDNITFNLTAKDFTYGFNATNAVLSSSNTTNYEIYLTDLTGGMWYIFINPEQTGTFTINILVNQYGYNTTTITFNIIITQTPAIPVYGTINYNNATTTLNTTLVNNESFTQIFSEGNQDEFNFTFSSKDSVYNELIDGLLYYNASIDNYDISYSKQNDNTFFITLNPNSIGNFSVIFIIYHAGYSNATLILHFTIITIQNGNNNSDPIVFLAVTLISGTTIGVVSIKRRKSIKKFIEIFRKKK